MKIESFRVLPFFKKAAFFEAFRKKLHQKLFPWRSVVSAGAFQAAQKNFPKAKKGACGVQAPRLETASQRTRSSTG
ncbi:hypothetical protein [Komagataeibacter xylinus]|uniref:hypothetical protein n=1 Tax=Komagataeibacter xylinus TaxID=28448 RepID=UPI0013307374|nr:hypothetical protein [Komagataeibacter xylinus]